jgi:hypothetical protein
MFLLLKLAAAGDFLALSSSVFGGYILIIDSRATDYLTNNINRYKVLLGGFGSLSIPKTSSKAEAFTHTYKPTTNSFHNQYRITPTDLRRSKFLPHSLIPKPYTFLLLLSIYCQLENLLVPSVVVLFFILLLLSSSKLAKGRKIGEGTFSLGLYLFQQPNMALNVSQGGVAQASHQPSFLLLLQ